MAWVKQSAAVAPLLIMHGVLAGTNTVEFGRADFELFEAQEEIRHGWDSGDALIATFGGSGSAGSITGGKNVVVVPEVTVAGNTIVPEVTRDTRSGIRLTTEYAGRTGVLLSAGMTLGGDGIGGLLTAGPTLALPDAVRAGRFFSLTGSTVVESSSYLDLNLPKFDAGIDIIIEGSASGSLEYGAYPLTGYQIGDFTFNIPTITLPAIDFNLDLNLPELPDFNFLTLPQIPASDKDNTAYRKTLPNNPLQSFGEFAVSHPGATQISDSEVTEGAIIETTTGDLARIGLDLDGIASFAVAGASFTGQSIPIKRGETEVGTLRYDTIDVKYGLELGYEIENRLDTILEATLSFVDPVTGEAASVLLREDDSVSLVTSYTGRWDQLPSLALLSSSDVQVDIDFTGLRRELTQTGSLTLSDYMELRVLDLSASARFGLVGIELGPLFYKKLELAGELAAFDIYTETLSLSDGDLTDGLWDDSVLVNAIPSIDTYLNSLGGALEPANLRRLDTHAAPATLNDAVVMIGTATTDATMRSDITPGAYTDRGSRADVTALWQRRFGGVLERTYEDYADPTTFTDIEGLFVPAGGQYTLGDPSLHNARRFRLLDVENNGAIIGDGYLGFNSPEPDAPLSIGGSGTIVFNSVGEITAGFLLHGAGHTIEFRNRAAWSSFFENVRNPSGTNSLLATFSTNYYFDEHDGSRIRVREITASEQFLNLGTIVSNDSALTIASADLTNADSGVLRAVNGGRLEITTADGWLRNYGLIESAGPDNARVNVTASIIEGVSPAVGAGTFAAADGGTLALYTDPAVTRSVILAESLQFVARDGGTITFNDETVLQHEAQVNFVTEANGTLRLNGLSLSRSSATAMIDNEGLIEFVSGKNSLREPVDPRNPGAGARIIPINLNNTGTIRVLAGAEFEFDVDIVEYAEGGATLAGGTWELLGQNTYFSNTDSVTNTAATAVIDVRVSEVFGAAGVFGDLLFERTTDPDTGEINITGISDLDTTLAVNASNIVMSGAASFEYLNTLRVNEGTFTLRDQHQFHTVGSYENRGGTTVVESGAGLHVAGGLFVNGGSVTFGAATEIGIDGTTIVLPNGESAERHIDVNGGQLVFAEGAFLDPDMISRNHANGVILKEDRTWHVRDSVASTPSDEIVVPGVIEFGITALNGTAGIVRNDATVIIAGREARFDALENHLTEQNGTLIVRDGQVYETPLTLFDNLGTLVVEGAQFLQPLGEFRNQGTLTVDGDGYLGVDFLNLLDGDVRIDGVVDANTIAIATNVAFSGGFFNGESIELSTGEAFVIAGGTLLTRSFDGALILDTGSFAPGQSIGTAEILGSYEQRAGGSIEIEWGAAGADFVSVRDTATLAGTVELVLLDGYVPAVGESIEFLTAAGVTGAFDPLLQIEGAIAGRDFALRVAGASVFIDVVASPVPLPPASVLLVGALAGVLRRRRRITIASP